MAGVVAVHNLDGKDCVDVLYNSLFNINHFGQEGAGIAVLEDGEFQNMTSKGLVRELRLPKNIRGDRGIGTVSKYDDEQPLIFYPPCKVPSFALSFDGFMVNERELKVKTGASLTKFQPEIAGEIIAQSDNFADGIETLSNEIKGCFSLCLLTEKGETYIARSPLGTRPLVFGQDGRGYVASSESRVFRKVGIKGFRDVKPGEIIKIDNYFQKTERIMKGNHGMKLCSFLYGYYSWIDSVVEGIPVNVVREKSIAKLVEKDKKTGFKPDIATGIEDSGKAFGEGYAFYSGVPYLSTLIKFPYFVRSYETPGNLRGSMASGKVSSVDPRIRDRIIVVCDDSIRRATVLGGEPIKYLKSAGAKEIHIRIGTPKNLNYCRFDYRDAPDKSLFANAFETEEEMAENLGVDSIMFPTVEEYVDAITECAKEYGIKLTGNDLCLGCYSGNFGFLE